MTLPSLQLSEPIVTALVNLLQTTLPATVTDLNATITDGYTIDQPVQYLDFLPVPSVLQGGMPAIAAGRLGGRFENDLQTSMDARHRYGIMAVIQNADHQTLVHQLERTLQAVAYVIQQDRLSTTSIMRDQAGVWSVNFEAYEPGPTLGDIDPTRPEAPPTTYLSWTMLILNSERTEV